jgi:hypothetical protein
MNVPEGFKSYTSKPILRDAYEIKATDVIHAVSESEFYIEIGGKNIRFNAHETIFPGDFVVYLTDSDVYHCRREVFRERNELN